MSVNTIKPFVGLSRYESWKSHWAEKSTVDIFSYVSEICSPEDVMLFCRLLFPDFVVRDDAVFLESRYDAAIFDVWLEQLNGDVNAVERVMNQIHLYDVFSGTASDVGDVIFEQLADIFAVSWRLVLRDKFPEKKFSVEVSNTEQDYGPTIIFFQIC